MAGFTGAPPIVTDGLVFAVDAANYESYPGSGTTWSDLSGNGSNGTLINGPTFNSGNGGYITFDGTDEWVSLIDNIGNPQQFTLSVWCRPTALNVDENNNYRIVFFCSGASGTGMLLIIEQNGRIAFRIPGGAGAYWATDGFSGVNQWGYITCVYDQVNRETYFNGVSKGTYSEPGVTVDFGSPRICDPNRTYDYESDIASVKIYNRVLTPQEVFQNYNALKSRFNL